MYYYNSENNTIVVLGPRKKYFNVKFQTAKMEMLMVRDFADSIARWNHIQAIMIKL